MRLIIIILGFVILVGGNQLYWMFTGVAGFLVGARIAEQIGFNQSEWQQITFATAAGLASTFLSYYLRKPMVILAGFLAGGYFINSMPGVLGWDDILTSWQAFVIAGAISALALILMYNLALIVISSLAGATLIVQNLTFGSVSTQAMFVVFIVFGVIAQWVLMQYTYRPGKE